MTGYRPVEALAGDSRIGNVADRMRATADFLEELAEKVQNDPLVRELIEADQRAYAAAADAGIDCLACISYLALGRPIGCLKHGGNRLGYTRV
jgi:hypothetical protein